jgi:NADH dehydrogenase FAD-containing subunit
VVLVDPSEHLHYSGMTTGVLSGSYEPGENRIGIRHLVERGGGRFVQGRVAEVQHRTGPCSSRTAGPSGTTPSPSASVARRAARTALTSVKPVSNLEGVRKRLMAAETGAASRVVIVGGGPAGCEVAANLAGLVLDAGLGVEITLVEAAPDLLPTSSKASRRIMRGHLRDLGVDVILGRQGVAVNGGAVLENGEEIRADLVLAATGVDPPDGSARSGLATGDDGALWVDRHLRSPNDHRIFGGGDAVAFRGNLLPRFGIYAIRQGPVLYHNLQATPRGEPLSSYTPQGRYLYVLDLGDGTGLAIYGPLTNRSRSALRLKHLIDRRFVREYS